MGRLANLGAKGFRPFFLLAGAHAAIAVVLWMHVYTGGLAVRGPLQGVVWHAHELIFGFTLAVVAGFLLTASENWTKRTTVRGPALLALGALWLAARVALVVVPGWTGAVLDLALLPLVIVGLGRAIIGAGSRRNYPFLGLLAGLWVADLVVFTDTGRAMMAHRVAVYLIATIILIVTGRVVPMFTRNATGVDAIHNSPALDRLAIAATLAVAALQAWPGSVLLSVAAGLAGLATLARTRGWWTTKLLERPLLWVLHAGHASVGVGLLLLAVQPWTGAPASGPLHVITVGGIGMLTIGMMARVSLGHTGRPLRGGRVLSAAFGFVGVAALVRLLGPWMFPAWTMAGLWTAAVCWSLGFAVFTWVYAPILWSPRIDGKAG